MPQFSHALRSQASDIAVRCITGIEAFYDQVDGASNRRNVQFDPSPAKERHAFGYIGEIQWFLYGTYLARYRELVGKTIESANDQEFLVFALCARSLVEITATLRYHQDEIAAVASGAKNPDAFSDDEIARLVSILDTHSRGGRFDWMDFYTSNRKDMAEKLVSARNTKKRLAGTELGYPEQINVQTAVNRWAKTEPWIVLCYDFFCELVHPNLGSTFLVIGAGDGGLQVGGNTAKSVGQSLCVEGIKLLAPVLRQAAFELARLIALAGTVKKD